MRPEPQPPSGHCHKAQPALPRVPGSAIPKLARWRLGILALCSVALGAEHHGRRFLGFESFDTWQRRPGASTNQVVLDSGVVSAGINWDEFVLSWNVETPAGTGAKFEARPVGVGPSQPFYVMGLWASDPAAGQPRESVRGQKDDVAEVQTDTLVLRKPAEAVEVRVTLTRTGAGLEPRLKFLGLSFLDSRVKPPLLAPNPAAWGRVLAVPERTQVIYPEGISSWCSPTSLSMLLAFWGTELGRPELTIEVPEVARAVHDPRWPGTGNWPFNTAFAGGFPGLRGYVTRLADVSELEDWVAAGVPVATSLSYNLLRGKLRTRDDGHIVVVRGFTDRGDVVVNDPGTGQEIRRTFPRANLVTAWAVSRNTVYLIYPTARPAPADRFGHW